MINKCILFILIKNLLFGWRMFHPFCFTFSSLMYQNNFSFSINEIWIAQYTFCGPRQTRPPSPTPEMEHTIRLPTPMRPKNYATRYWALQPNESANRLTTTLHFWPLAFEVFSLWFLRFDFVSNELFVYTC